MNGVPARRERVTELMRRAQAALVQAFEEIDGRERFREHRWARPGGGGGTARVIEGGAVFERGGVNVSAVHGTRVPESLALQHPGIEGLPYFATGVSMVLHPRNPYVPAFHANFRYFEVGDDAHPTDVWWFGGGSDMTPAYPFAEDARLFHRTLRGLCERHAVADYGSWKATCDRYFTLRHRGEMRGIGGIFFDEIAPAGDGGRTSGRRGSSDGAHDGGSDGGSNGGSEGGSDGGSATDRHRGDGGFEAQVAFVEDGIATLLPSYLPIVRRRKDTPFGERERAWQAIRRGRYVEFNLVYDRGTAFGLQTQGNVEAILMSMPPMAAWRFDHRPEPGSAEEAALRFYQPHDWAGDDDAVPPGSHGAPPARRDGATSVEEDGAPAASQDQMFHVKRRRS